MIHSQRLWHSQSSRSRCFSETLSLFDDPTDVCNLTSGSSAFPKCSLNIWNFTVLILLKAGLKYFDHYLAHIWDECSCAVVWAFFGTALLWMKTDLFQSSGHGWVFQICWHIECSTFTASSFWIWNSSTGTPSPALCSERCFLRPTWLHIPGCLALGEWSHHCGSLGHEDLFCIALLCILATSS